MVLQENDTHLHIASTVKSGAGIRQQVLTAQREITSLQTVGRSKVWVNNHYVCQ